MFKAVLRNIPDFLFALWQEQLNCGKTEKHKHVSNSKCAPIDPLDTDNAISTVGDQNEGDLNHLNLILATIRALQPFGFKEPILPWKY